MNQDINMADKRIKSRSIRQTLLAIYNRLFTAYGPQHWWPAESPFEVMVGAILTQSAAWKNVEKAITNLKAADALSPQALRRLGLPELAALVRPSGYYKAKARKLKAMAEWLGENYGDDIAKMSTQTTEILREQLLGVHGIGPETADSIILYAANQPVFVIDAYTRRIFDRLGIVPEAKTYAGYKALFMNNLPADKKLFNEYHALLVQLGK
ncbi:MAG: endonuclease, partial [Dehalococcoidales bacterium]|nr:endonuclease [Dehalococcoidales bacterium]